MGCERKHVAEDEWEALVLKKYISLTNVTVDEAKISTYNFLGT